MKTFSDSKVVLSFGTRSQVLYSADGIADDPHYDVVWAGDLDADGKLDLVVNLHQKYSWHPYTLLLSSRATPSRTGRRGGRLRDGGLTPTPAQPALCGHGQAVRPIHRHLCGRSLNCGERSGNHTDARSTIAAARS